MREDEVAGWGVIIMTIIGLPVFLFMLRDGLPTSAWTVVFYLLGTWIVSCGIASLFIKKK